MKQLDYQPLYKPPRETNPWNNGSNYESEIELEPALYHWRGGRKLFAVIVGSLLCIAVGVAVVL